MASIVNYGNGLRRIEFTLDPCGPRKIVRIGRVNKRDAESIRRHVENLIAAKLSGQSVAADTARWLPEVGDTLHDRLAKAGLVEQRAKAEVVGLGTFVELFIAQSTAKPSTILTYRRAGNHLLGYFDAFHDMRSIGAGDADAWWAWLRREREPKLSDATARKTVQIARQFWKAARRRGLVDDDPFAELPSTVRANRQRDHFVTLEDAAAVLDACPDSAWRLIFALGRFGGLRLPSELRRLRWSDVDWERGWFTVRASKTEHHEAGGIRRVPIFDELFPFLRDAFEEVEPGGEFVIGEAHRNSPNLGTHMRRIIERAGLVPWPKTMQNLRASRQTELAAKVPLHLACSWLGNSRLVAQEHYLQVRESDFASVAGKALGLTPTTAQQKAQQAVHASVRQAATSESREALKPLGREGNDADGRVMSLAVGYEEWAIQDSNL